jgi:hypothetical protein
MNDWIRRVLSESNLTPSSIRVALLCVVAAILGVVIYCVVRHILSHEPFDLGPNLTSLLSVSIGSLSAAKLGSKFGEQPPQS